MSKCKPYWRIINPCDNCPRENTNVEIITRWQDPTIEELKNRIDKAIEMLKLHKKVFDNSTLIPVY